MNARTSNRASNTAAPAQARTFRPLSDSSQMMLNTSVMYFDASMPGEEIHEQARYRISVAQRVLESYSSSVFKSEDELLGQSIATVTALLISDAMALVDEMGRRVSGMGDPLTAARNDVIVPMQASGEKKGAKPV